MAVKLVPMLFRGKPTYEMLGVDERTYKPMARWNGKQWRIVSGCRNFSIEEAKAHWAASRYRSVACWCYLGIECPDNRDARRTPRGCRYRKAISMLPKTPPAAVFENLLAKKRPKP